jgi:hypothetical protein
VRWGGQVGAQVPGTAKMRKKAPKYSDYYIPGGCTCPICTGYYGGQTSTHDPYKSNYAQGTDGSSYDKYDQYYRGSTDSNYSKSEMTEFQKRLQESMQEMQRQDSYERERARQYQESRRQSAEEVKKKSAAIAKLESEYTRLVEGMLEGINAKEASGTISSEEAESLVKMVVDRVFGADKVAGIPKEDPYAYNKYDNKY